MDQVLKRANRFVNSYNNWADEVEKLSPYSPDYKGRVIALWEKYELGRLYRGLENEIYTIPERL